MGLLAIKENQSKGDLSNDNSISKSSADEGSSQPELSINLIDLVCLGKCTSRL